MPSIAVVVPWRPDGGDTRLRAWWWVSQRYRDRHSDWEFVTAPGGEPWVKARAVMPAIAESSADVIVVADADVWCDGTAEAVEAVLNGSAWALPHRVLYRLTPGATRSVIHSGFELSTELDTAERPMVAYEGGGIVVARRETLLEVPLDPRFVGWGCEDEAWAKALNALAGHRWRGKAPMYHLFHVPQEREHRRKGNPTSWALWHRYDRATRAGGMEELIREAKHELDHADQQAVHDPPAEPVR